jgi:hypothetical protein
MTEFPDFRRQLRSHLQVLKSIPLLRPQQMAGIALN